MCDTLGTLKGGRGYFAKNSDRSPNEVQVLEYYPAAAGLSGEVKATYRTLPQAGRTNGVLISRPIWMWGAEIGVNDHGLCIGNEAVFTKGKYGKEGLTGMDLLRLALERCGTAREAVDLIIELLEQYGQGGNCGFDHDFFYDNAFLIMDRGELYVLETAGKHWAWRRSERASISNCLSIGTDWEASSEARGCDFRKKFTEPFYTRFSGSAHRRGQTMRCLPDIRTAGDCMAALSQHREGSEPLTRGSVDSVCMHFGGLVGDHTTASMVVDLQPDRTLIWATGSSLPCLSLFKPWLFGTEPVAPVFLPEDEAARAYWVKAEEFRRDLIGKEIPAEYHTQREAIQSRWLKQAECLSGEDFPVFSAACLEEERRFYELWGSYHFPAVKTSGTFRSRWEKKNAALKKV